MRRIRLSLFAAVLFLCFSINASFGQAAGYSFSESAGTYAALGGTNATATGDDGIQNGIAIGFNFVFGGATYTHFSITTNGFIKLGTAATTITTGPSNYTNGLSNTATNRPLIAAFWDDNNRGTGAISYAVSGTAPNQVLTVDWNNVNIGGDGSTSATNLASYQIKLYQTTNVIEVIYDATMASAGTLTASVGLNDASSFLSVTPGAPGTVSNATANNAIGSTTDIAGKKYTFTPPSCSPPGGLNASAITQTTATVGWTAASGSTSYEWAVTASATPPATGTNTTGTSASVASLTANTVYYLHVRTNCGGTFSPWVSASFTTSCAAVSIPYTENFDGVTAPALANCITKQDVNGNTSWNTGTTAPRSTPNCMIYNYNSSIGADDWFYTAPLNLTGGTSYRISFYYKARSASFPEKLEVKYGNSNDAVSMTNNLVNFPSINQTTYQLSETDFTPATSGTYYVGFHAYSIADQFDLNVDDISVTVSPSCVAPTGLFAIPTGSATTADLAWTAPATGTPTGYEWAVTTSATPPATGTAVTGTTATATSLTYGTLYYMHVRTDCGGSFSNWATISFVALVNDAPCGAIVLTAGGPEDCGNTTAATSTNDPAFSCSTPNNTVWYKYTPTANGVVDVKLKRNGATGNLNAWVQFYTVTGSCPNLTLTQFGTACDGDIDLTTLDSATYTSPALTAGTTYYILIDGFSGASGAYCIQLLPPPPPPPCVSNVTPANTATGVTAPNTSITWNSTPTATSYDVFFGTTNPPTTNIGTVPAPDTTAAITGLLYGTTYYWYIVPKNGGSASVGCSTNVTSFTTQSTPPNCVPQYGTGAGENCSGGDLISLFRLKGETTELNINSGTTCSNLGYVDSTDHPVIIDMARGKSYWGQVLCGFNSNVIAIWIDFDDDGLFETNEKLMNNLTIGTTLTNINLFIPLTAALGNHRMRVRDVYSPVGAIDACALYTYGETEDYTVNITAGGASYIVSTYASTGTCFTGAGSITIDATSNNNGNYVPLVDSSNALVAQLYPQGNNLGRVNVSYYKHNGAVRQDAGGRYYLDRNLTITVATQPTTPYNLRFPYQNSELNALIAQPGSGVTSQFDLVMTKNGDACLNAIGTGGTGGVVFFPTGFGSLAGDRFVDVTNITGGFSSFYLHGGSTPIPVNLVDFKVQRAGKVNNVSWSTSQEVNTSHFVIERSNDGNNFTEIGRVTANGNSNTLLNYSFVDANPVKGINYYRLRVVDRDNSAKFSATRSVRNEGIADIAIYPNPVNDVMTLTIDADKAGNGALVISDITGKVVATRTITVAQGNNKLPVNTAALASGAYIIKVQLNDDIVVRKFTKQ